MSSSWTELCLFRRQHIAVQHPYLKKNFRHLQPHPRKAGLKASLNPEVHVPGMDVVDVWVEAGREGRAFTYVDRQRLGLAAGDLVQVSLRGRPMQGLVIACRAPQDDCEEAALQPVNRLVQRAAVDPSWRSWLDAMAHRCHTSYFRMLKAALPLSLIHI